MTKILVTGANGQLGKELQDFEGQYSRFKFFFFDRQILDITNPTPAKRSKFSVMDKSKIHQTYSIEIKDWRESPEVCLDKLIQ